MKLDQWTKVRDAGGEVAWVENKTLGERRNAIVTRAGRRRARRARRRSRRSSSRPTSRSCSRCSSPRPTAGSRCATATGSRDTRAWPTSGACRRSMKIAILGRRGMGIGARDLAFRRARRGAVGATPGRPASELARTPLEPVPSRDRDSRRRSRIEPDLAARARGAATSRSSPPPPPDCATPRAAVAAVRSGAGARSGPARASRQGTRLLPHEVVAEVLPARGPRGRAFRAELRARGRARTAHGTRARLARRRRSPPRRPPRSTARDCASTRAPTSSAWSWAAR